MNGLGEISAIVCDTGGTVFDWFTPVRDALEEAGNGYDVHADWDAVTRRWRIRSTDVFKEGTPRRADLTVMDMDEVLGGTLGLALEDCGAVLPDDATDALVHAWRRMRAWPDVAKGVADLRSVVPVAPFTILRTALIIEASRRAGVDWDTVISCEAFGVYKTHPDSYRWAARLLDLPLDNLLIITTHNNDLDAASEMGLRTAYIHRKREWGDAVSDDPDPSPRADVVIHGFGELLPIFSGRPAR